MIEIDLISERLKNKFQIFEKAQNFQILTKTKTFLIVTGIVAIIYVSISMWLSKNWNFPNVKTEEFGAGILAIRFITIYFMFLPLFIIFLNVFIYFLKKKDVRDERKENKKKLKNLTINYMSYRETRLLLNDLQRVIVKRRSIFFVRFLFFPNLSLLVSITSSIILVIIGLLKIKLPKSLFNPPILIVIIFFIILVILMLYITYIAGKHDTAKIKQILYADIFKGIAFALRDKQIKLNHNPDSVDFLKEIEK